MPTSTTHNTTWTRLIRFKSPEGDTFYGEPTDLSLDIGLAFSRGEEVRARVWSMSNPWDVKAGRTDEVRVVSELLCPIADEDRMEVHCIGLNYKSHALEMDFPIPNHPVKFFKPAMTLTGPFSTIPIPSVLQSGEEESLDYEVEFAVIISKDCLNATEEEALEYVLGYTCANDVTYRYWQKEQGQWCMAKGFDKFCPIGPCIVSRQSLPHPEEISLSTHLNGTLVQDGKGEDTLFSVARIVSFLSQGTTLRAGTVILTGTPPGIGASKTPPVWMRDGDEVRCSISHGIGTLINTIKRNSGR